MIHFHTCAGCGQSVTCVCSDRRAVVYCANCMTVAYILTGSFLLHRIPTREEREKEATCPTLLTSRPD
jgi:hypothetical protein